MNENITPKGRVRVFGLGGAGINIAPKIGRIQIDAEMLADVDIALVDTSRSNLTEHASKYECYLVDGLDGSGKIRAENAGVISERIKDILQQHKPGDLVIVVHSGGGGSGSVIGPLMTSELLARDIPVVVLMIGSVSSKLEAENTLKTLKSYEAIAQLREAPVVMHYLQNSPTLPRSKVDEQIISTITYLSMLYSRRNRELDTRDLRNWLRYTKPVTSFNPQLAALSVVWHPQGDESLKTDLSKLGNVISVATLAPENMATDLPIPPEYHTVGFLQNVKSPGTFAGKLINFVISDGMVNQWAKSLNNFIEEQTRVAESRVQSSSILSSNESANKNGLIL